MMVGLPGFEPGSITPEATSLDHASRKPHLWFLRYFSSPASKIKIAFDGAFCFIWEPLSSLFFSSSTNIVHIRNEQTHKNTSLPSQLIGVEKRTYDKNKIKNKSAPGLGI